nr:filamentous hemagglutinin N-terminal domain-containing protein [Microcoleaceae cyanobacterium MO_207.B10]
MKTHSLNIYHLLALILGIIPTTSATAQPITPANDGTNTTVTPQGNEFNIEGGTRSGANLFHSFDQFNLNSGQTANFLSTPDTSNILGRITGGNASYINGLIQVIGGNSNLFLMNPAGIMFGSNASLNVPASFSVTTATGIGFDNNNYWFQAMGTNDYANLVGQPSGYHFNVSNPGAIVNEGNLSLNPGENLTLLGGTVINTGQLSTPGGNITIAAVEGGSTLRISQPGHLLSLEVDPVIVNGEDTEITALSLPELLTGGEIIQATSVTVNENGDVVLKNSNTLVADTPGTTITSGQIDVSISPNPHPTKSEASSGLPLSQGDRRGILKGDGRGIKQVDGRNSDTRGVSIPPSPPYEGGDRNSLPHPTKSEASFGLPLSQGDGRGIDTRIEINPNTNSPLKKGGQGGSNIGGNINIFGDRVALIDTNINADGTNGGGQVLIGGDFQGNGIVPNSQQTFINNNSIISTDAINNGNGGRVIIWSDGITNFAGNISARGGQFSGNGGFVEVSGKQQLIFDGSANVRATFGTAGTILLDPENIILGGSESNTSLENLEGNIILEADNDITINEKIETTESVELKAGRTININADIDTSVGNGNIDLLGNNDEMNLANRSDGKASINQLDGTILNAGSGTINIQLGNLGEVGDINLGNLTTTGEVLVNANGGNIVRVSENSIINAGSVLFQTSGTGGIGLTDAPLQLNVDYVEAVSGSGGVFFDVGNVNIGGVSEEVDGIVTIGGGDIDIKSAGNVTVTENIFADVVTDSEIGGDININAQNLSVIDGAFISASTFAKGDAGDVTITTGSLEVKNGAVIDASTFGKGDAGSVEINATETVVFDGGNSEFVGVGSLVYPGAEGNAGGITITTGSLEVKNGAVISASTLGKGDAGSVEINATETVVFDG